MANLPQWRIYLDEVRKELDDAEQTGKVQHEIISRTWKRASTEYGYPGLAGDWRHLLQLFGEHQARQKALASV